MTKKKKRRANSLITIATTHTVAPRNPFSNHPLMRKGGAHEKTKSAQRAQTRRETKKLARDWSLISPAILITWLRLLLLLNGGRYCQF